MIKPHGSDELNPLFVYDSEKRHALIASLLVGSVGFACFMYGKQQSRLPQLVRTEDEGLNALVEKIYRECVYGKLFEPMTDRLYLPGTSITGMIDEQK